MFIYAYALRQLREYLYILMATEKILHLKFVCLVVTSDLSSIIRFRVGISSLPERFRLVSSCKVLFM
jgi:hypothetical protein